MTSGTKRTCHDDVRSEDRRSKPRDWRDVFLDEDRPRRERPRESDRHGGRRDDRDRDRDRDRGDRSERSGMSREREYRHPDRGGGDYHRDREPDRDRNGHSHARRHGDTRDWRRDSDGQRSEREEGEITSPPRPSISQPLASTSGPRSQARSGFKPRAVPTAPRSSIPQTRPSNSNVLEPEKIENAEPIVVLEEERDPEKVLEDRRRKREAIMAKFKANAARPVAVTPVSDGPLPAGAESVTSGGTRTSGKAGISTDTTTGATPLLKQLGTRSALLTPITSSATPNAVEASLPATPLGNEFDLTKQVETAGEAVLPVQVKEEGAAISAADYDPTKDKKVDEEKRRKDAEFAEGVGELAKEAPSEFEEVEIEEEEEEDLDMFAAFGDEEKPKKKRKVMVRLRKQPGPDGQMVTERVKPAAALDVVDNVDDTDGYYRITPGEILDDGRYQVTINLGKGMFSAVVKAKVLKAVGQERRQDVVGKEVAIKVIRSQESMYVAGRKEAQILKRLNEADPEDKKHIVRMDGVFEHRGHLCIVTESLSMNLRDVIKRFGKDVGLNMRAVRAYAHQMFLSLSLMRKCSIVHADIKPDNILVSENKAVLKVCDLGSASDVSSGEITPYLVSRFYRAPEIILGLPFDTAIDIWSVGCTLYELYTGKIFFPGRSNNHMLLLMMEVKGKLNHRMIKKAAFGEMHFDESMNFVSIEKDKITGQDVAKTLVLSKATRDLRSRLLPPSSVQLKMKDDELKQLHNFIDLLDKCLQLDPARRMTPRDALSHPFLAGH